MCSLFGNTITTNLTIAPPTNTLGIVAEIFRRTVTTRRTLDHQTANLLVGCTRDACDFVVVCGMKTN